MSDRAAMVKLSPDTIGLAVADLAAAKATLGAHDPLITELVRLLARAAAERDYEEFRRSKNPDGGSADSQKSE